jgi:hypothetical protein
MYSLVGIGSLTNGLGSALLSLSLTMNTLAVDVQLFDLLKRLSADFHSSYRYINPKTFSFGKIKDALLVPFPDQTPIEPFS